MRLFHTSDCHLGQNLHGQDRDFEHACFLTWLLARLAERKPDVLLIAGDIFDTVNPPVKAQERLYDFIVSAHQRQSLARSYRLRSIISTVMDARNEASLRREAVTVLSRLSVK